MLSAEQKREITALVHRALDNAERVWNEHGMALDEAIRADSVAKRELVPSKIPGHKAVESGSERVGTFIALVADMRDSSKHLLQRIAGTKATELQRIFYETSALLPALELTIQYEGGAVTEYLGDGLLALFAVEDATKHSVVRAAWSAGENCVGDTRGIVNDALAERYKLPPLNLGIGMAMSKAVVSLVGIEGSSHAKLFGQCVWYATNLADGKNEVIVDEWMEAEWPTTKNGGLRFRRKRGQRGVDGFLVTRKSEHDD